MKKVFVPLLLLLAAMLADPVTAQNRKPNVVVIFTDDMGYGDLGVYGNPTISTPNLDRMAFEGQKWTNFYVAAPVCTPSRAALMTGRLPVRTGMSSEKRRVLFPDSKGGLPQTEITIARNLKKAGYKTGAIGKWHLGHQPEYVPTAHGFDYYLGIPYSNDMDRVQEGDYFKVMKEEPNIKNFNVPLIRNNEIIERPADQHTITRRYTEEAVRFIKENKNGPFFLYLAHSMPHVPLFASKEFKGKSLAGLYGDVIEEIDWSVGQVLKALKENGIDENTLVVFTSDNGPWLIFEDHGGSSGHLRGGKGGTFDGGMRVPAIFRWPGKIKPGVVHELGSTLDLFPTLSALAQVPVPNDRIYDGYDLTKTLLNGEKSPRNEIFYYRDTEVYAVRQGNFKVHYITQSEYAQNRDKTIHNPPLVYNLGTDPGEKYNLGNKHPEVIKSIAELLEKHKATLSPVENQLEK